MLNELPSEMTVIFENKHILAVNKPAGLVVHGDGKTKEPSLADWLLKNYPAIKEVGEPMILQDGTVIYRPGIVHRLDRETSGVMVIAKTQESFEYLKKQFQEREVRKVYNAVVWGLVKEDKGTIDRPIGRSRSDFRKWSAQREARGDMRPAVTDYKVLGRIDGGVSKPHEIPMNFSYIEAYPRTGRTHQIRVHFKAINHPVVCDSLYAANHPEALGFKRLALHARSIEIEDIDGKTHMFEAPQPTDFLEAVKSF
ncbi:MAG: RluA family pseudouridine synthase [Patescibacteria group bacterium]